MTNDERAIRDVVDTWMTASKSGDLATLMDLMTDDMLFMAPGREPFGKDAFHTMSQAMKGVQMEGRAEVLEVTVVGDWAWLRNHIDITIKPPDGSRKMRHTGYTLTVLRKGSDGRWRLARDANLVTRKDNVAK
jgi:uncharacterized protein (TIGR02246 family)